MKKIEKIKEFINQELDRYFVIMTAREISDYENGEINIMKLILQFINGELPNEND